jgi:peptidoglycan/xylan/chitin deacetylase (PgdA/CDA1 family)
MIPVDPNGRGAERIVFNFHGVGTPHAGLPADELPYWCARDLFLKLLDAIAKLPAETGAPVEITFDDGNRSDLDIAAPALAERDLSATFFACAGRLDDPRYLDRAALRTLEDRGMMVGSHGHSHVDLRKSDQATLQQETSGSRLALAEALRGGVDSFAIPFGSYDRRVLGALRSYRRIYTSDQVRAGKTGLRIVPRISYVAGWGPETVRERALERYSFLRRQKNSLKFLYKRLR